MTDRTPTEPPWPARFRAPHILWAEIAPLTPSRGIAVANPTGVYQLYAWDVPAGALRLLVERPEGRQNAYLAPDGGHVYYLDDRAGNEIGHWARVPWAEGPAEDVTPDLPPYASSPLVFSPSGNRLGFFAAGSEGFTGYWAEIAPDGSIHALQPFYRCKGVIAGPLFSYDGNLAVMTGSERGGKKARDLLALDLTTGQKCGELWDGPAHDLYGVAFQPLPGSTLLLAGGNCGGAERPLLWDVRTGQRTDLDLGPLAGDVLPVAWTLDGQGFLLCQYHRAEQRFYLYDLPSGSLARAAHGGGAFGYRGRGICLAPGREIYTAWSDASHPPQAVAIPTAPPAGQRVLLPAGPVPPGQPWRSITFPSSGNQQIQGWLSLPAGAGPFPAVIALHGGPETVQTDEWQPQAQAWVDSGFAYLTINYRGSTGFGPAFHHAIIGDLGRLELEDMAAARAWLVFQGIARSDQVFLTGWSYGGYLTLLALGKQPELWAGGLAGMAIADWTATYEDVNDRMRAYQVAMLGGTPEQLPDLYADRSPITHAGNVRAPALVIQGRNDTRTPARQMARYEARMRELGKTIEVHWFDAGHRGAQGRVAQAIEHMGLMLRFGRLRMCDCSVTSA